MKRIFTAVRLAASLILTGVALLGAAFQAQATPTLYVADGAQGTTGTLYIMDPTTGLITQTIGPIGFDVTGMAFDPTTGTLYGSTNNQDSANPHSIISIDPTTGAGTLIGDTGTRTMDDLAFDQNGTLYGWSSHSGAGVTPATCTPSTCRTGVRPWSGISAFKPSAMV